MRPEHRRRTILTALAVMAVAAACSGGDADVDRPQQVATSTETRRDPLPEDPTALQPLVEQMVLRLDDMPASWFVTGYQTPGTAFLEAPAVRSECEDFRRTVDARVASANSPVFARADTTHARLMASSVAVLASVPEAERLLAMPDDPDIVACLGESFDLGRALGQDEDLTGARGVLTRDPLFPLVGEESVFLRSQGSGSGDAVTETNLVLIRTGRTVAFIFVFGVNGTLPTEGIADVGASLAARMDVARPE